MKTSEYLYGINPEELDDITYWNALRYKIEKGTELFRELYTSNNDNHRLFYVNKAMLHTRKLLEERDEKE